jgi:hypothetical protein
MTQPTGVRTFATLRKIIFFQIPSPKTFKTAVTRARQQKKIT